MSDSTRPIAASAPDPATTPAEALMMQTADAGTHVAEHVRYQLSRLSPTIVERLATWQPQLTKRDITIAEWRSYECTVRTAAVLAAPSSESVAAALLATALNCVTYAVKEKSMYPNIGFVFRETTTQAYLATLEEGTAHVYSSHLRLLVAGVRTAQDLGTPVPQVERNAEATVDDDGAEAAALAASIEPLMMRTASLTSASWNDST